MQFTWEKNIKKDHKSTKEEEETSFCGFAEGSKFELKLEGRRRLMAWPIKISGSRFERLTLEKAANEMSHRWNWMHLRPAEDHWRCRLLASPLDDILLP